jgi:hypothetical protein
LPGGAWSGHWRGETAVDFRRNWLQALLALPRWQPLDFPHRALRRAVSPKRDTCMIGTWTASMLTSAAVADPMPPFSKTKVKTFPVSTWVIGGGFGGVLLPVPNTNVQIGPRVGIQGSNITGSIASPAASPLFTYTVRADWMAYQEAFIRFGGFKIADNESPRPQDRVYFNHDYFNQMHVTGSAGVAESGTSVKGTSGMFSVTDNVVRTGITFTAGIAVPVVTLYNGAVIDLTAQYRGTQWISTVNIPGAVNIGSYTNEVTVGATLRFNELFSTAFKNRALR